MIVKRDLLIWATSALLARIRSLETELLEKAEDIDELEAALVELETESSQQLALKEQEMRLLTHQHELQLAQLPQLQVSREERDAGGDAHHAQVHT